MNKVNNLHQNLDTYFWLPAGDENLASSRLRCYYLHREFLKSGISSYMGKYRYVSTYIIQKRLDFKAFFIVVLAKICNAKLILDIDDIKPGDKDWEKRLFLFGNLVDAFTSATEEQLNFVKNCLTKKQKKILTFYHFENPIDYDFNNINDYNNLKSYKKRILNIGWFGNACNFNLFNEFDYIKDLGYNLVIIADYNPYENIDFNNLKFIKWDRNEFHSQLYDNVDICILSHFGDKLSESKSANKLIASIAIGVPVVASATPSYSKIAKQFGIENFLYTTPKEVNDKLKLLSDTSCRDSYFKCRDSAEFYNYTSSNIAYNYNNFIKMLKKRNSNSTFLLFKTFINLIRLRIIK